MNTKPVVLNVKVSNKSRAAYWRTAIACAVATGGKLVFSHRERQNVYNAARSAGVQIGTQMTEGGEMVEMVCARAKGGAWKTF